MPTAADDKPLPLPLPFYTRKAWSGFLAGLAAIVDVAVDVAVVVAVVVAFPATVLSVNDVNGVCRIVDVSGVAALTEDVVIPLTKPPGKLSCGV